MGVISEHRRHNHPYGTAPRDGKRVAVHFEEHYTPFDMWFEVDAYPTKDGLAVFGRDVTERKRFNERLQQTQKLESLGVLAGGIAHDFNNLLTGIMGNASIMLEDIPPESPVRENLEAVLQASERAAVLTRQMLAYAGKGRFVIERSTCQPWCGKSPICSNIHSEDRAASARTAGRSIVD